MGSKAWAVVGGSAQGPRMVRLWAIDTLCVIVLVCRYTVHFVHCYTYLTSLRITYIYIYIYELCTNIHR